jgi:hypothetical protein
MFNFNIIKNLNIKIKIQKKDDDLYKSLQSPVELEQVQSILNDHGVLLKKRNIKSVVKKTDDPYYAFQMFIKYKEVMHFIKGKASWIRNRCYQIVLNYVVKLLWIFSKPIFYLFAVYFLLCYIYTENIGFFFNSIVMLVLTSYLDKEMKEFDEVIALVESCK